MKSRRQLAVIMFTDIVGYTPLMQEDEQLALRLLSKNRQLQKPIIEKNNGNWLKELGDGVLASFNTVTDAVYAAAEIQKSIEEIPNLQLRIGIHLGEVVFENKDVFGSGVNIASRIESVAPIGGVLVSESVHKNIINKKGITSIFHGEVQLKGVSEPIKVFRLNIDNWKGTKISTDGMEKSSINGWIDILQYVHRKQILRIGVVITCIGLSYFILQNIFWNKYRLPSIQSQEKSIAVLPFISLSSDPEKQYLADAVMDAVLLHLSKIEKLRVITRTSVERYRHTTMTIPEIAVELNVQHILEGSFQKYGEQANLIVQLSNAQKNEDHLWAKEYTRDWSDIFKVQSQVAQNIAHELKAVITPEEKQIIEKIPTTNLTAYDFYQRGREELIRYQLDQSLKGALSKAEYFFFKAIEYDSMYAQAYTGLADVFWKRHYWDIFMSQNLVDSVLSYVNTALALDEQLGEAYVLRGNYYRLNYNRERAIVEYRKAIKYDPNLGEAYWQMGQLHEHDDLLESINNFHKAASLLRGSRLPQVTRRMGRAYAIAGLKEEAINYTTEALKLDGDSAAFYGLLMEIEDGAGNPEKSIEFGLKANSLDSTNSWVVYLLAIQHMFLGKNEEYLKYMKAHLRQIDLLKNPSPFTMFRIGHAYWVNGFKNEAERRFKTAQKFYDEMLGLGRHFSQDLHTFYNLAAINAFLGNREKAYEYLQIVNEKQRMPRWMVKDINHDPLFDSLRNEPEFRKVVKDVEKKYQAEHERVKNRLAHEGII